MPSDSKQARRQQSHLRILDAAARALCRDGYAGVGVASVMKEAGLTHGGFYAHFESRDALLAAAVEHAGVRGNERLRGRLAGHDSGRPLRALVDEYLSETHVAALENGCPVAALGPDLARGETGVREAAGQRLRSLLAMVEQALPAQVAKGSAMVVASTMVGALQLARALPVAERASMLEACRTALVAQYEPD